MEETTALEIFMTMNEVLSLAIKVAWNLCVLLLVVSCAFLGFTLCLVYEYLVVVDGPSALITGMRWAMIIIVSSGMGVLVAEVVSYAVVRRRNQDAPELEDIP
jgi:hypothetical protein